MNEKERKEFDILKKIYKIDTFENVVKRENPDFILEHNSGYKFGAEITELYFSESNARIRNIPSYISNILSNRTYKHKDDIEKFKVGKFIVISDGKPDREIDGIIQKLPEKDDLIDIIVDVINNKSEKYDNYDAKLGHINLIIYMIWKIDATLFIVKIFINISITTICSQQLKTQSFEKYTL